MTGWLIGNTGDFSPGERTAVTLMALAPDIDGIFVLGPLSWREWHRTFGHNVFWGVAAPLFALYFIQKGRRWKLLPFLYLGMLSHFILDLFVTGWWILMPLWPVSEWGILMSRWIPEDVMKYWIQLGLFAALLIPTVILIVKKKHTPLEILGKRADAFFYHFVTLPFREKCAACGARAFYRCNECGAPLCGRHRKFSGWFGISCREGHIYEKSQQSKLSIPVQGEINEPS